MALVEFVTKLDYIYIYIYIYIKYPILNTKPDMHHMRVLKAKSHI